MACLPPYHLSRPLMFPSCSFPSMNRREKGRASGKFPEANIGAINDGGQIGGLKLFELSQTDWRKKEMPIKCSLEVSINTKFKEHLINEVQKVWKVINRRQVIC